MEVSLKLAVKQGDVARVRGEAVAVNLYSGVKEPAGSTLALDKACGGIISHTLEKGGFKGGLGEVLVLYPQESGCPERVILLGLGKKEDFDAEAARLVGGALVDCLRTLEVKKAVTVLHGGDSGKPARGLARGLAEGIVLGAYRYDAFLHGDRAEKLALERVTVVERLASRVKQIRDGVAHGVAVAHSVNEARELVNGPSNVVTPTHLAETARRLGREHGFKVKVLDRDQCEKLGMGAFLGVAKGSDEPCKFIVMEYESKRPKGTVCLVGKGITFDTGGISIKPAGDMDQMKYDMGGAAAVIGAMRFVGMKKPPLKVVGLVAATENMPGGHAYKPGDILESSAGVTIEVLNTDAEGRLVLADALDYAKRYEPDAVVDLATLTGACVIALGGEAAGLMSNDEWFLDTVYNAAAASGERAWPLPMWTEYRDKIKSNVADIKNTGGRSAGAITAGAFLGAFTNGFRWAHLDIAGTAWGDGAKRYQSRGGTGAGVRILAQMITDWKKPKGTGPRAGARTSLGPVREAPKPKAAEAVKATKKVAKPRPRTGKKGARKRKQ
jgi:leucyl aminopeptidase